VKIAITADLHLNPKYPERALALQNILKQLEIEGIKELIIAGDLFDKDGDDAAYLSFLDPCRSFPGIRLHLIPGNHDSERSLNDLSLDTLEKYQEPQLVNFADIEVLFLPYVQGKAMAEMMNHIPRNEDKGKPWALVGHGDFIDGLREPNPREKGIYMPLRKSDLNDQTLKKVFLGHIHKPTPLETPLGGKVIYPGSPQGLDVSETGHRRFLVLDTENFEVTERKITSGPLYLDWKFFVFPSNEEVDGLFNQLDQCLAAETWEKERQRVQLRIRVEGFTKNKDLLVRSFQERISSLSLNLYESSSPAERINPNFDALLSALDTQRNLVARKTIEKIDLLAETRGNEMGEPSIDQIKMAALKTIYQVN